MRTLLASLIIFYMSAIEAHAEVTVKEYKEAMVSHEGRDLMRVYIRGLGEGIAWANTEASAKKVPMFCEPPKLGLGLENFIDILDRQIDAASKIRSAEALDKTLIGLLLLKGFEETFPCGKTQ